MVDQVNCLIVGTGFLTDSCP